MTTFVMRHDLDCSPDRHWEVFLDNVLNKDLYLKHLGFPHWEVLEVKETDKEIIRRVKATPKLDAPAAVVKILGDGFGYTEEGRFDREKKVFKFVITPSTLQGKLRNEGTVRCEPRGEGKCTRVVEIIAEAKVFGVGGMLESMTEKNLRDGWGKSATYINDWLKSHP